MKFSTGIMVASAAAMASAQDNLVELAVGTAALSNLTSFVIATELTDAVAALNAHTLFAPTDDAFGALGEAVIMNLEKSYNSDLLTNTLLYHIVPEVLDITSGTAEMTKSTLLSMENLTIGAGATVNGNAFSENPVDVTNGARAYVVNDVLVPSSVGDALARSIVGIATGAGIFTSLVEALTAADLASTFDEMSDTGYTVFAPTDTAFTNVLNSLGLELSDLAANKTLLTEILTYHVVAGVTKSTDLSENQNIDTLEGQSVIYASGKINDANLVSGLIDLRAYNGIVHVIDAVLVPDSAATTLAASSPDDGGDAVTTTFSTSLLAFTTLFASTFF